MVSKRILQLLEYALICVISIFQLNNLSATSLKHPNLGNRMGAYDVALKKTTIAVSPIKYGVSVPFQLFVYNQGTSAIKNVQVIDYVPSGLQYDAAANAGTWVADPMVANGYITTISQTIQPGDSVLVTIGLIPVATNNKVNWINTAEVFAFQDTQGNSVENQDMDSVADKIKNNDAGGSWKTGSDNSIYGDGTGMPGDVDPSTDEDDQDVEAPRIVDLALQKIYVGPADISYGDTLSFKVIVYNQGNEQTGQVLIKELPPEGYKWVPALNPGWILSGNPQKPFFAFTGLNTGMTKEIIVKLVLLPDMADGGAWDNYTEIFSIRDNNNVVVTNNDADSTPNSNSPQENAVLPGGPGDNDINSNSRDSVGSEDDHDGAAARVLDIALIKTRSTLALSYSYTQQVVYNIIITNQGNVPIDTVYIVDSIPCGLSVAPVPENAPWTLDPITMKVTYVFSKILNPTVYDTIQLIVDVNPCLVQSSTAWTNYAEVYDLSPVDGLGRQDIDSKNDKNLRNDKEGIPHGAYDNSYTGDGINDEDDNDPEILEVFDLAVRKTIVTPPPYSYGQTIDFLIRVYNQGNVVAKNIQIEDLVPPGYTYSQALNGPLGWSIATGDTLNVIPGLLVPNASVDIHINLTIKPSSSSRAWTNFAHLYLAQDTINSNYRFDDADSFPLDPNAGELGVIAGSPQDDDIFVNAISNTGVDEDDSDVAGFEVFDLSLTKTILNPKPAYIVGEEIVFNITVFNEGSTPASNIKVVDYIPCGLSFSPIGNLGWSLISGKPAYTIPAIAPGTSVTISIKMTIVACAQANGYTNKAEIALINSPVFGTTYDIDSNPDENPNNDPPGEDDIDDVSFIVVTILKIGDYVWEDMNGNGLQDGGEPGIANVTVKLYNLANFVVATTTTNASGYYSFIVNPGTYYLKFDAPDIYDATTPDVGGNDLIDSDVTHAKGDGSTSVFTLSSQENLTLDAGFYRCVNIGELVWYDVDKDDIKDQLENGINGVKVELWKRVNGSWTLYETQYTGHKPGTPSDDGYFRFCTLPGEYYVRVLSPPTGLVLVRPNVLGYKPLSNPTEQNNDSDITNNFGIGSTESFLLVSGGSVNNIGAGYYPMATAGNLVWLDVNNDGIQQINEQRMGNVLVEAFDASNVKVGESYTNAVGEYKITYLAKQDYFLRFTPPQGYSFTTNAKGEDERDSDVNHANGANTTSLISFNPGMDYINIDAGIVYGVLPVDWKYVKAEKKDNHNLVSWTTLKEINTDNYIVERKYDDATEFESIGVVKAVGYSLKDVAYSFEDYDVEKAGTYIYRVKQIDIDGKIELSKEVIVIRDDASKYKLSIYPNPTSEKMLLQINSPVRGKISIAFYNNAGGLIKSLDDQYLVEEGVNNLSVNLEGLINGIYNVKITGIDDDVMYKLIIVH